MPMWKMVLYGVICAAIGYFGGYLYTTFRLASLFTKARNKLAEAEEVLAASEELLGFPCILESIDIVTIVAIVMIRFLIGLTCLGNEAVHSKIEREVEAQHVGCMLIIKAGQ